jgi:hypothetical protein
MAIVSFEFTAEELAAQEELPGIKPATGSSAALLSKMERIAADLFNVIGLEKSGVRDGDGYWHGADVLSHSCDQAFELAKLFAQYSYGPRTSDDDDFPIAFP